MTSIQLALSISNKIQSICRNKHNKSIQNVIIDSLCLNYELLLSNSFNILYEDVFDRQLSKTNLINNQINKIIILRLDEKHYNMIKNISNKTQKEIKVIIFILILMMI